MISKITKTLTSAKFRLAVIKLAITACIIAMAMCSGMITFANDENTTPDGVSSGNNTMSTLTAVVFWVVRTIILVSGGVPGLIKINQGQADENPRDRNAGIACIVVAGFCFAATFVIEKLI